MASNNVNFKAKLDPILEKLKVSETFAEGKKQLEDLWSKTKEEGKKTAQSVGRAIISGLAAQVAKKGLPLLAKLGAKAIAAINHPGWYADADRTISGLISAFKPVTSADAGHQELICGMAYIPLDVTSLIELTVLKDQIGTAISAFDSMLGASSGITYDQIIDVLKAGAKAVAALTIGKRFYDGRKAKLISNTAVYLQDGTQVSELLLEHLTSDITYVNREGFRSALYDISDSSGVEQLDVYAKQILPKYPVINNATWTTDIVSPVCNVFCPDKIYEMINYLYSGYFTNGPEHGVNGLVCFIEDGLLNNTTAVNWQTYLTTCMTDYRSKLSINPFLEQFMTHLGFGKPLLNKGSEYNRWLAADIYSMYEDAGIIAAIANYMTSGKLGARPTISGRYKYDNDMLDVLDNSDDVDITFDPNNILITNIPLGHIGSLIKLWLMKPAETSNIYAIGVKRMIASSSPYNSTYQLTKAEDIRNVDDCATLNTSTAESIATLIDTAGDIATIRKYLLFINNNVFKKNTSGLMAFDIAGLLDSRDSEYVIDTSLTGSDKVQFQPLRALKEIVVDGTDTFTIMNLSDVVKVMKTNISTHYNFSESYKKALELWNQTNNIAKF